MTNRKQLNTDIKLPPAEAQFARRATYIVFLTIQGFPFHNGSTANALPPRKGEAFLRE